MVIKSGGITRFKFHLSNKDPHSNRKKCPNVPPEVKKEMRQLLVERNKAKAKKAENIEEIRAELRGTMRGSHRHLFDDNDGEMMMKKMRRKMMMSICIRLTSTVTSELTIEQHVVHSKLVNEIDNKKKGDTNPVNL